MKLNWVIFFLWIPVLSWAQSNQIDSLKKILLSLKDTSRIDCLNTLSFNYTYSNLSNKDTALFFANLSYEEAKKINYIHGIAIAFLRRAQAAKHFDDDFTTSENMGKESLIWFDRTANKVEIDDVYDELWFALFSQSRFDEAIYYAQKKYSIARKNNNQLEISEALGAMVATYRESGDYEKSFSIDLQVYDLAVKMNDKISLSEAWYGMAQLFALIDDYPDALIYFRRVLQMDDNETRAYRVSSDEDIWFKMEFTEVFSHLNQFDSAWHYYNLFKPEKAPYLRVYWVSTGECYFLQEKYQQALQNFKLGLAEHKRLNDENQIMRTLIDMGKTFLALKDNTEALQYGREGLNIAMQTKAKQFIRDGYQILSTVYDRLHQRDSANLYFRQYIVMKGEVLSDQAKGKFAAYNYEQKTELLNKENVINQQQLKIQQQQLDKGSLQRKILIGSIFGLIFVSGIVFRNIILKRKNEKNHRVLAENELQIQKLKSQKQLSELEMQALRAQMNPHFIFNSLNSINRFILQNNRTQASEYLTKFSKLVRLILQNSQASLIPLESELESLELYLNLEALRFNYHFDYKIFVPKDMDISALQVPPLILQPYVENAIWHGLMHKEEKGQLDVELSEEDDHLYFKIADNGIGRERASALASKSATKHKSMGLRITAHRIAIIQNSESPESPVTINDLLNADGSGAGTEVIIKMPVIYD